MYNGPGYINPYSLLSTTHTECDCKNHSTQWNAIYLQWECANCNKAQSNDPHYSGRYQSELKPIPQWTKQEKSDKTCQCGSASVGSNRHSEWCEKYEKN